jgi:hypothetical protein
MHPPRFPGAFWREQAPHVHGSLGAREMPDCPRGRVGMFMGPGAGSSPIPPPGHRPSSEGRNVPLGPPSSGQIGQLSDAPRPSGGQQMGLRASGSCGAAHADRQARTVLDFRVGGRSHQGPQPARGAAANLPRRGGEELPRTGRRAMRSWRELSDDPEWPSARARSRSDRRGG